MGDRLAGLLNHFELHARVFQAGPLCHVSCFDGSDGLGYIHVLKNGRLEVSSNQQDTFLLEEPSLFFYMNSTHHQLSPQGNGVDLVCASFDFGHGIINPLSQAMPNVVILKLSQIASLSTLLDVLFTEANAQHCGRQSVLDRLIEIIIIQLLRELMDQKHVSGGLLAGLSEPRLARAINAIHNDPSFAWTLQDLASTAGMSRARFSFHFRNTVGMTPGHYLMAWRISVAQSLIRRGDPLQRVAGEVGYANASALSRAFMAQTGQSPSDWKKQVVSTE